MALPKGWWTISVKGSRSGVINAIEATDIPAFAKQYLRAEIQSADPKFNFVAVDCHRTLAGSGHSEGQSNLHLTITPSIVAG